MAPVFVDGAKTETLRGDDIVPRFLAILDDYVAAPLPRARQRRLRTARRFDDARGDAAVGASPVPCPAGRDICYLRVARIGAILAHVE